MTKVKKLFLAAATLGVALSMLSGCNSDGSLGSDQYAYGNGVDGAPVFMGQDGKLTTGDKAIKDTFYFAFDSSELDAEAKSALRTHARYLTKNQNAKLRVEGHTDERGSREYNVALGERRAKSVASELFNEGVTKDQVAIVSYGEEKPAVQGHDESAWQWNRRGQLNYELG
jgi:peptidoglycan-associated lipoprotein